MAGGHRYIINDSGKVLGIRDLGTSTSEAELTVDEAVVQANIIRRYMQEVWGYRDQLPLSLAVLKILEHVPPAVYHALREMEPAETPKTNGSNANGHGNGHAKSTNGANGSNGHYG